MNLQNEIQSRFAKVINETIKPPILIGQKWLECHPDGKPAPFQFRGAPKIAKASGKPLERVLQLLTRKLDFSDLGLEMQVDPDGVINLAPKASKPAGGKVASPSGT